MTYEHSGIESARRRSIRYAISYTRTIYKATDVFTALTGIGKLHRYGLFTRVAGGWGFCYHCKTEQTGRDFLLPYCDTLSCKLTFNRNPEWAKESHLKFEYPNALWLSLIDFSSYRPEHREYE